LFLIETLAVEDSIADTPELKDFVAKLREKQPSPVAGSTWQLSVNLNDRVSVSLVLLASANEAGWVVQTRFSSPPK
jgi:hypothetical protein